jgi:ABC-type Na+ efflux pump permease subunit
MVGAAGVIYHLESRYFYERTLRGLTYAAPFAAPLSYIGLGFLLLMNRMVGQRTKEWAQWVIFLALGGFAGNFVLSLTDHAVNGFFHWTEWIPVVSSALAIGFLLVLLLSNTRRGYVWLCAAVVVLQAAVGVLGFLLHGWADLHGPSSSLWANIVHGAPPFAPLLLPNLAILGILGLLAWARLPETERGI